MSPCIKKILFMAFFAISIISNCSKINTARKIYKPISKPKNMEKFPSINTLDRINDFPSLFKKLDGTRVNTPGEWEAHRDDLKQLIQYYEYGFLPPAPEKMVVKNIHAGKIFQEKGFYDSVKLECGQDIDIILQIYRPKGQGPFPVVITGDLCWGSIYKYAENILDRGYAIIEFDRTDVDEDNANRLDGLHALYPRDDFGTIAAWAWAYMCVIDYTCDNPVFDKKKITITGHSRGGKTALLAGALDERVTLTNPHCSGIGGAGPNRYLITGETINDITDSNRFHYWFNKNYLMFRGNNVSKLPFDQHALVALVAPRAYLSTNALDDAWANPEGTQLAHKEAEKIFQFLDAENKIQIHFREGEHEQNESDWKILLDYADEIFYKKQAHEISGYHQFKQ